MDEEAIARAPLFTVCRFLGRDAADGPVPRSPLWDRREFPSADYGSPAAALAAAKAAKAAIGRDQYGRAAIVYAVTNLGATIHVE
jgi:hypothetical protein